MKLTDFLDNVGRPVAYYPKMKQITGGTTATILLCQFIYWRGKEADGEGWLYKTSDEIEDETGLTYNEQKTARKMLVDAELLQERYARLDHQMMFRIDLDKINEKWGMLQHDIPEHDDSTFGNEASQFSLNSNTETTTETTQDDFSKPEEQPRTDVPKRGDVITMYLAMINAPGMKSAVRVDNILSYLAVSFSINTETKRWREFAKFADNYKQTYGGGIEQFVAWVKRQKGFDITFWTPQRMQEMYPQAFVKQTDEEEPQYPKYVDPREGLTFVTNPYRKKTDDK